MVERRVQQHQVKRAAQVCQQAQRLGMADVALPLYPGGFAVGLDDGQRLGRLVDEGTAFGPAGQRLDAQLAAAGEQVQHPRARHQKLHAGKHRFLDAVDGGAGHILAREGLQHLAAGRTCNDAHGGTPLSVG